jgi:alkylation response protein AidB-like acyl-CoA dehydrogenase
MSYVLVPRSDFTIVDDWHVMGLRGTGSKSAVVDNVFVPPHRIVRVADTATGQAPGAQVHDNPLYRAPMLAFFPFFIASPAAGIARGAFEAFIDDMKVKTGGYDKSPMAKKPGIQMRVAEAGALIDAADLLFKRSLRETMAKIFAGEELSLEHRVRSRRDQAYSISMARHAAEILFSASGARALYDTNRTQRAYRDLQAVSAHAVSTWDGPALNYGQVMLGGTPSEFAY